MNLCSVIRAVVLAATLVTVHAAVAQTQASQDTSKDTSTEMLGNLQVALKIIDSSLARHELTQDEIDNVRQQVEFVADSALRIRAKAMRKADEQTRLLQALGPKPGKSEPPEAPAVTAERDRLENRIAQYQGEIKSSNVLLARVDALRARLSREQFTALARILLRRTQTPLSPGLIGKAAGAVPAGVGQFVDTVANWWQSVAFNRKRVGILMWWLVLLVFVLGVVVPARNWLLRHYGPDHREENPSFTRRFRVMLAVGFGNAVLPVVSIVGLFVVFVNSAAPTDELHLMVSLLTVALCQYFLVTGLADAAMSPDYPNWRISHFTNESAVRLYRSIRLFAAVVVLLNVIAIVINGLNGAQHFSQILTANVSHSPLQTVFAAIVTVTLALTMAHILRRDSWKFVPAEGSQEPGAGAPGTLVRTFFWIIRAVLLLAIVAALAGFVNLGVFLTQRVVWSLLLIAFAYLLREFIAAACRQSTVPESGVGTLLRDTLGYSKTGASRLVFWVLLVVDIALVAAVVVALLLFWGVQASDIQNAASKLFFGISIGSFNLSLLSVIVSLGLFAVLFFSVRLLQSFLSRRVFAQMVPDVGVRDALTTGVGYAGIIIAAFIAISTLGLQLSQLAIIFGALSVGIGFGLQHVVNNFISGLILLMQRPIKAGDWIAVGQHQGYVKRISVVATEIQTFDNASVIVPNSQLVTSEVLNWTHKSTVARVIISVGVSYDSDPRQVRDLLLRLADVRDEVLKSPAPAVVFRDFGESALIFELRFFIRQADYMLITASELRFDICDAFRDAGIVIPFPQRDIHIRDGARGQLAAAGKPAAGEREATPARRRVPKGRRSGAGEGGNGDGAH